MKMTLRELFLLVVIAAMGCRWWVDRQRLSAQVEALVTLLTQTRDFDLSFTGGIVQDDP